MKRVTTLLAALLTIFHVHPLLAQGTAFTYQGRLTDNGIPATGNYDLRFAIYDVLSGGNPIASPMTNGPVAVGDGVFTVVLDFGAVFTGGDAWLEIGVRTNGSTSAFIPLLPRQPLTPTPYALYTARAGFASNALTAATATNAARATTVLWSGIAGRPGRAVIQFRILRASRTLSTSMPLGGVSFDYGTQNSSFPRGQRWVYIGPASSVHPNSTISTWTGAYLSNAGVWTSVSDKNRKTDFQDIDSREILERLADLPVRQWRYTNETSDVRHVGPTAQDFKTAFGLGADDKTIGAIDAGGGALAAIKGLNQKLEEQLKTKDARIDCLEAELSALKELVM